MSHGFKSCGLLIQLRRKDSVLAIANVIEIYPFMTKISRIKIAHKKQGEGRVKNYLYISQNPSTDLKLPILSIAVLKSLFLLFQPNQIVYSCSKGCSPLLAATAMILLPGY